MKKTLGIIIDTAFQVPPNTGVTYRLYYLSKAIVKNGMAVKIFICNRNIFDDNEVRKVFDKSGIEYHIIPEETFYDEARMSKIMLQNKIDIIQFEDQNTLLHFSNMPAVAKLKVCLELHDIEAILKSYFKFKDSHVDSSAVDTQKACQIADLIICMTPFDFGELLKLGVDKKKIKLIPNPIDLKEFKFFGPNVKSNNLVFMGNMYYWPNKNAAQYIAAEIFPHVAREINNLKAYFIGMVPDELRQRFAGTNLIFTGPVDNISEYLRLGTISLCPITEGSGMKVKILNYSAAGLPVISTPLGISGYEKIRSLIVEDKVEDFSAQIIKLLKDKSNLSAIGRLNRRYIADYYESNASAKKIIKYYLSVTTGRKREKTLLAEKAGMPLWLKEKRIRSHNNKSYYVIQHGKVKKIII